MRASILLIFLDGFGLGAGNRDNPLYRHGVPSLEHLLGVKLIDGSIVATNRAVLLGIDAQLGVEGIPQSATGQTSLLTGKNAQALLGYHLPAFPNDQLIKIIEQYSLLKQLSAAGLGATFANSYTEAYFKRERNLHSVTTHCVRAAGIPYRMTADLLRNDAVYWDITRDSLVGKPGPAVTAVDPFDAGRHLTCIAGTHDFVLFECFEPDLIGHATDCEAANRFLRKLDRFFSGILSAMNDALSVVICSDHGNFEDLGSGAHTRNRVPLIVIGPAAPSFTDVEKIDQVATTVQRYLTDS
ncbi:MAG: hypothetical protein JW863_07305 [Chitinispirillaceae bacterium]|nr:hypothetical protein [Chitinispirillaceae bacterium]